MKKQIGKWLLLLAAFVLAFTATAFAEGDVCKIGEQGYATLAEAIAAVQAGETITLTQDAEYPGGEWTKKLYPGWRRSHHNACG